MNDGFPVSISGCGITTNVGRTTAQSCAAMRAGIARFRPTEAHLCRGLDAEQADLESPIVASVPWLDPRAKGLERLLALAFPALAEAVESSGMRREALADGGLHVAIPEEGRPGSEGIDLFTDLLCERASLPDAGRTTVSRAGHSGFAEALQEAVATLEDGGDAAVVVCVDSMVDRPVLRWLDENDRLKCSRSPEGVVPGEAGAAIVLRGPAGARRRGPTAALATLDTLGSADDPAPLSSGEPWTGTGLTEAIRKAASRLEAPPDPPWVVLDHNGERHRAAEWGYVLTRLHDYFTNLRHSWLIADCVGDVGAAVGGVAAARIIAAHQRGYAPGAKGWILLSSDEGGRGAVVLGPPRNGSHGR